MLEDPALVSASAGIVGGLPNPSPPAQKPTKGSLQPATPSEVSSSSCLESIRRHHASVGVSEQAAELLAATAYQSGWQRWYSWCNSRETDPIHCGVQPFLDFLTDLFQAGLQYCSIDVIRSSISTTHVPLEGAPIGQHPLVTQLLRGVYNSRPPMPRYTWTWDVDLVVRHLRGLGNNTDLSLKRLSGKLVLLMALTLASRTSELQALDDLGTSSQREFYLS